MSDNGAQRHGAVSRGGPGRPASGPNRPRGNLRRCRRRKPVAVAEPLAIGSAIPDIVAAGLTVSGSGHAQHAARQAAFAGVLSAIRARMSAADVLKLTNDLHGQELGSVLPLAIGDPADVRGWPRH